MNTLVLGEIFPTNTMRVFNIPRFTMWLWFKLEKGRSLLIGLLSLLLVMLVTVQGLLLVEDLRPRLNLMVQMEGKTASAEGLVIEEWVTLRGKAIGRYGVPPALMQIGGFSRAFLLMGEIQVPVEDGDRLRIDFMGLKEPFLLEVWSEREEILWYQLISPETPYLELFLEPQS